MKLGDTKPGGSFLFIRWGPTTYPIGHGPGGITLRGGRAEYSVSRSFSAGFAYASMGSGSTNGYRMIPVTWRGEDYYSEAFVTEERSSDGYFLTAAWMPVPPVLQADIVQTRRQLGLCVSQHRPARRKPLDGVDNLSL
jgi:hypothetical protein